MNKYELRKRVEQMETRKDGELDDYHRGLKNVVSYVAKRQVLDLIDELEEPETLSKEWILENAKSIQGSFLPFKSRVVYTKDLENLILPKQESTEEPEIVADVIADFYKALERMKVVLKMEVDSDG